MGPEGIMLNEKSQRNENTIQYHLYVEYKKYNKLGNKTKRSRLTNMKDKLMISVVGVRRGEEHVPVVSLARNFC